MQNSTDALQRMRSTAEQLTQCALPRWLAAKQPAAQHSAATRSYLNAQAARAQEAHGHRQRWRRTARRVSAAQCVAAAHDTGEDME